MPACWARASRREQRSFSSSSRRRAERARSFERGSSRTTSCHHQQDYEVLRQTLQAGVIGPMTVDAGAGGANGLRWGKSRGSEMIGLFFEVQTRPGRRDQYL